MKHPLLYLLLLSAATVLTACGGRRHDAAFYEQQIDSIRRAEQLLQMKQSAGVYDDPVDAFLDTLDLRPLPIENEGADYLRLGHFSEVPKPLLFQLGYTTETKLQALALPRCHGFRVLLLAELSDGDTSSHAGAPVLSIVTLDKSNSMVDQQVIYYEEHTERGDHAGTSFFAYYITSHHEVTLLDYFQTDGNSKPHLENEFCYKISPDGHFEESLCGHTENF